MVPLAGQPLTGPARMLEVIVFLVEIPALTLVVGVCFSRVVRFRQ
jgi:hypothetical protein